MKIVIGGQMGKEEIKELAVTAMGDCLLYTSDAADD